MARTTRRTTAPTSTASRVLSTVTGLLGSSAASGGRGTRGRATRGRGTRGRGTGASGLAGMASQLLKRR